MTSCFIGQFHYQLCYNLFLYNVLRLKITRRTCENIAVYVHHLKTEDKAMLLNYMKKNKEIRLFSFKFSFIDLQFHNHVEKQKDYA